MSGCCLVDHMILSFSTVWCYFIDCITHFLIKFGKETTSHLVLYPAAPTHILTTFVGLASKRLWEGRKEKTGSLSYNGSVNENENKYVVVQKILSLQDTVLGKKLKVAGSSFDSVCVKFTLLFISFLQIGRAPTSSVAPEKSDLHANCSCLG